jgi:hypothetical protein
MVLAIIMSLAVLTVGLGFIADGLNWISGGSIDWASIHPD